MALYKLVFILWWSTQNLDIKKKSFVEALTEMSCRNTFRY